MLAALDHETRDWIKDLKNKVGGPCCDTADGFPVEIDGWDMAGIVDDTSGMTQLDASNARSGYRVRLGDGKWHDVPNFALVDPKTNKLGYAVVWLLPGEPSDSLLPSPGPRAELRRLAASRSKSPKMIGAVAGHSRGKCLHHLGRTAT